MRKLLSLMSAMMLMVFLISCHSDGNLMQDEETAVPTANKTFARGEEDYLAKDSILHAKSGEEVYYMGERLEANTSADALLAQSAVRADELSRRVGHIQCKATMNTGIKVYLVSVSGDDQPNTYWIVTEQNGVLTTYVNGDINCRSLYWMAMGWNPH